MSADIPANDNRLELFPSVDRAIPGQALSIVQPHRKFGRAYAEFVGHAGDGKHILVRKLISGMWKGRWTKPMRVARSSIIAVHNSMARGCVMLNPRRSTIPCRTSPRRRRSG